MTKISINNTFNSFINDPGIQLSHPKKENIILEDIFVFPNVKCPLDKVINSKKLIEIANKGNAILISGPEDSGKTTLVKVLIKHFIETRLYPIYIDTQNYSISNTEDLMKIIDVEYEGSYSKDIYPHIQTQSKINKAVLIDNFDKLNNSSDVVTEILDMLSELFGNVILTGKITSKNDNNPRLHTIFPELSSEIKHYEILEFNEELRLELIQKWNKIGIDDASSVENSELDIEKTRNFIDTVIGHNLVASYPVYLLTILQMNNQEEDLATSGSTFSHYYEYLIIKSLQSSIGKERIQDYDELLSKISFYMFEQEKEELSADQLEAVFRTSPLKSRTFVDVLQNLIKSETLSLVGSDYRFKYRYAYHYFVAKYLSTNIDSEKAKVVIKKLCSELGNENSANIVLFITHMTDDVFVIDELSASTESMYDDINSLLYIDESTEIDELLEELSRLGSKDRKLKELVVEYTSNIRLNSENERELLNARNNLLRILKQALSK